ncbi:hypothetical protein E2C01_057786 [Portunus trituberculatus]|uniref:Uncharacterized protein n=1 Tax=Portunus trituberculatus TaxID=210409 RepID=A0A5B7H4B5_PORTR|nr:hypothetical protein [Portunus trituberculatus]
MRLPSTARRVLVPCLQNQGHTPVTWTSPRTLLTWCHTSRRDRILRTLSRKDTHYFSLSCCRRSERCRATVTMAVECH